MSGFAAPTSLQTIFAKREKSLLIQTKSSKKRTQQQPHPYTDMLEERGEKQGEPWRRIRREGKLQMQKAERQ